jgi:hypothetical protein
MQWICDPLLKVALPGDMEQVSRNPKADDREVTEMCRKKAFDKASLRSFRHDFQSHEL